MLDCLRGEVPEKIHCKRKDSVDLQSQRFLLHCLYGKAEHCGGDHLLEQSCPSHDIHDTEVLTGLSRCLLALTRHLPSNSTASWDQVFSKTDSVEHSRSKLETRKPFFSLGGLILLYDFIICTGMFPSFWFLYVLKAISNHFIYIQVL